ncbi:MAG: efflux transporter periplasmic adaptor subunit [Flavobacteriaceae bacterium]|nr:efflux transporter periplasmic adaptor subunit [Flavobacteriaceae bacterium]|tara:strand:+ start:27050 stop:28183 length:1134 start_codon:yes stop_codon:yes gene_type:complete
MKTLKYTLITLFILAGLFAVAYFIKTNSKSVIDFEIGTPFISSIEKKTVVTGKVIPEDEVEIKPQISGIIQEIFVEEGDKVNEGDLLAKVKVVPNEGSLNSAKGRVSSLKIILENAKIEFNRNKTLYEKDIISEQEFQNASLRLKQSSQDLNNAKSDLQVILQGTARGSSMANTNIRASVSGTILEIPVKEGDQVVESNTFNAGTTIATIADLSKMIFEGKVDEAEVGKLSINMPLTINLGAIQDKEFMAKLKFIAPKGNEEQGAVKFKIEGDVVLNDTINVRAGYSANASIVLEKKENVMVISESLLQFDKDTQEAYVEIQEDNQKFERRDIKIGISDGINVEIISGLSIEDKIKVWNKTESKKIGDKEEESDEDK